MIARDGRMRQCTRAADRRVSGVLVSHNDKPPGHEGRRGVVAAAGPIPCRADAKYGAIKARDLLTTSRTRGHAMKVTNPTRAVGAILGKALEPLHRGCGIIRVLLALQ